MAMSYGAVSSPGLLSQQYRPPLLPKPGKDNARLQKMLKKAAKKKAAQQAQQTAVPFRSSLSPVNEASADLEHSDHSTPPATPETPTYVGITLHPRFSVRPLYQHVASPYPQHRGFTYGMTARFSPQPYGAMPSQAVARPVTPRITHTPPPRPVGLTLLLGPATYAQAHLHGAIPASPVSPLTPAPAIAPAPAPEINLPVPATKSASEPAPEPASEPAAAQAPMTSTVPLAPAKTVEPSRHLTITALVTHKAPSPKFNVFNANRTSRPMFEVPLITIYTAKTSYYESTTPPPLHDTSRLSYYGRSPSPRSRTPTPDTRRGTSPMRLLTPVSDSRRGASPTSEIRGRTTPTPEVKRGRTPTIEIRGRTTPTPEVKRGTTPTSEVRGRTTPISDIRGRAMPISEVKRGTTPTSEMQGRATPTSDLKKGTTPTSEVKRGPTPTIEINRVKTPTFEFTASKTPSGRPKTPSHHVIRAKTPVFEISRPNPLLFAVSPEYTEGKRSKTPTLLSVTGEVSQKPLETEQLKVSIPNGDVQMTRLETKTPTVISKPEAQASTPETCVKQASGPPPPTAPSVSLAGTQKPKTPTQELYKPDTPKTGYQQPKAAAKTSTPPAGPAKLKSAQSQAQALKPIIGLRPKTPTRSGAKSTPKTYYGLTPAAYVAHGGIQTTAPSFSVTRPRTPTAESPKPEEMKGPEKQMSSQEVPKAEEPSEQKAKTTVAEVPTLLITEEKASVGEKPQEATKLPVSQAKTKPVPVVEKAKPQVTEVKQAKSPATSTAPKISATETPKTKVAISVPPKPKTPTSETKTSPAQKQITALFSKAKKESDETKKQDAESKTVMVKSEVSKEPAKPKDSALETSTVKASGTQSISSIISPKPKISEPPKTDTSGAQPVVKPKDKPVDEEKPIKEEKAETKAGEPRATTTTKEKEESTFPKAEPLLKAMLKPKGMMKSKVSAWSRLKKHMVVEVEEPKFPEDKIPDSTTESKTDTPNGDVPKQAAAKTKDKEDAPAASSQETADEEAPRAPLMWDALLFQMFSSKENIMQQIKSNKSEEEQREMEEKEEDKPQEIPAFAHRLPVLLFSPRFDAKKLREAASRPVTKMSTVFEMGLIGRKIKDEEPKQFNRTARGFSASNPTEA